MVRILISLFFLFSLNSAGYCQNFTTLDKIENSIFGMTYSDQDNKKRIERLEQNIYGAIQSGNINKRLEKLSQDTSAQVLGEEITPQEYTDFEDEEQEDNSVDYPIINELEKTVFNQEFKSKAIDKRLTNLEQKVFNKTYNDDLNSRTERLKLAVIKNKKQTDITPDNYLENYENEPENLARNFEDKVMDKELKYDKNVVKILNTLEKKTLKRTYPNENQEKRIERLEENMFNTTFPQDSLESRLERLAVAYQATKTSKKYDANKLSQHMATAMQVGMFLLMILAMVL